MSLPEGFVYQPGFLGVAQAAELHALLWQTLPWERHSFTIYGRTMPMPRRMCMFGPHGYAYSGVHHPPAPLPAPLEALRQRLARASGMPLNSVLANGYDGGSDSMSWHSDADAWHEPEPRLASVSLGAARRFHLRRSGATRLSHTLVLEPGSVLWMTGRSQADWQHALPKTRRPVGRRINLTYRVMVER